MLNRFQSIIGVECFSIRKADLYCIAGDPSASLDAHLQEILAMCCIDADCKGCDWLASFVHDFVVEGCPVTFLA